MNRSIAVAVSGGTDISLYENEADTAAREIVDALLSTKVVILSGANVGFPDKISKYAEEKGVPTIRFSSEASYAAHIVSPRASTEYATALIYTGFGLTGADTILIRSADIVIIGPGAVGTIHEFAGALEEGKVLGVLTGPWHTDEIAISITNLVGAHEHKVVFDSDPKKLVSKLLIQVRV
jgi:predicted Rossmann-fold nucleotide-binding protein